MVSLDNQLCVIAHAVSLRVLRNEAWLRLPSHPDWTTGLIKISHFPIVFPKAKISNSSILIERISKIDGYTILDMKCDSRIQVQPSLSQFKVAFDTITGGVLRGLDWNNVFVAGGVILGTLLSPAGNSNRTSSSFINSDIDLYIHGLGPTEATTKIREIFKTYKSDLTPGAPTLIVRNSRTITFFSNYPTKRIQIVLKLVSTPKEVLLNFDLDICAAGYDGTEVYLLPRTARALASKHDDLNPPSNC